MKIVATIPARLGSQRVPRKNLRLMNGEHPMIWYAIRAALDSNRIDEVYVNSESPDLGAIALEMGARFYRRPPELAGDHVSSDEFNHDFMQNVEADIVVMVNPVAPLIRGSDVDEMVQYYLDHQLDTLIPVREEHLHAFREREVAPGPSPAGWGLSDLDPVNFDPRGPLPRTQDNPALLVCAWTVCIWRREVFLRAFQSTGSAVFSGRVGCFPQHPISSLKVSREADFRLAEILLRYDYLWRYPRVEYDSTETNPEAPAMWSSEITFIENLLLEEAEKHKELRIVEWGSGRSTVHFSKFLKRHGIPFRWHAVENYYPWYFRVGESIRSAGLSGSTEVHLKSATFEDRKSRQEESEMSEFVEFPLSFDETFDVALIDGRKRRDCLEIAARVLKPSGVAILHDAEREDAHPAFRRFRDGGRFVVENGAPVPGGVQKLWVGRPRAESGGGAASPIDRPAS